MGEPRVLSSEESLSLTHSMESAIKHSKQSRDQREDGLDPKNWGRFLSSPDVTELQDAISEIKSLFSSYIKKNLKSFDYIHNLLFDFLYCYCNAEINLKTGLSMKDILPWLDSAASEVLVTYFERCLEQNPSERYPLSKFIAYGFCYPDVKSYYDKRRSEDKNIKAKDIDEEIVDIFIREKDNVDDANMLPPPKTLILPPEYSIDKRTKALRRAAKKYDTMAENREAQFRAEHGYPKQDLREGSPKDYNLLQLAFCEATMEKMIELVPMIQETQQFSVDSRNKVCYEVSRFKWIYNLKKLQGKGKGKNKDKEKKDDNTSDKLPDQPDELSNQSGGIRLLAEHLQECYTYRNHMAHLPREYVAYSLALAKYERAYHLILAAKIAEKYVDRNCVWTQEQAAKLRLFSNRYDDYLNLSECHEHHLPTPTVEKISQLLDSIFNHSLPATCIGKNNGILIEDMGDIVDLSKQTIMQSASSEYLLLCMDFDQIIQVLFPDCQENSRSLPLEQLEDILSTIRRAMTDCSNLLFTCSPMDNTKPWQKDDWKNVAEYLFEHYNLAESFMKIQMPITEQDPYFDTFYRFIYKDIMIDAFETDKNQALQEFYRNQKQKRSMNEKKEETK